MTIRVLIADDQEVTRAGLRMILDIEDDIEIVGEARDGLDVVRAAERLQPDVVLMDVRMPVLNGLEATGRIVAASPDHVRVLILTTFDVDEYLYTALQMGASGFILKDAPAEELVEALRIVAGGDGLLAPDLTRRVIEEFARRPQPLAALPDSFASLTPRELEVLEKLAHGLSNAELARRLFVSETTIKTHVARLLAKLDVRDRVQAVVLAYESGLVRPGNR